MKDTNVFVYGTLRKNESNHGLLKRAKLVSQQAKLKGSLFNTGQGYPALMLKGESYVYGEIYNVDDNILANLDVLEGYTPGRKDNLYERQEKQVETDIGIIDAWVYVLNAENDEHLVHHIPFQDWKVNQWYTSFNEVKYFAYGSCMDTARIKQAGMLDHFSKEVAVGRVKGYEFLYSFPRPDGARADIKEASGEDYVEGIVYTIPRDAVEYLFVREGVHSNNYRPTFIDVEIKGEIHEDVLTFSVIDKHPCTAPPEHYATEILRGAKGRLSNDYFVKLQTKLDSVGFTFSS
ncbi:gamma-glutamylcyclotransferase [Salipaludibacillus keqinensis]|uniref:Gamma-glutamylcyclotransferase family protein n=1 Tax=Salipaludibacillus keqinensis TaxID=2045207 RepID=A0A323TM58_9BACI|nr:gamma-glutamylcyclotransferase family protein [Salipaludibacillus keqinensis]PYZ95116.1 gamma-glutamylcyclotransferase [Salipaludibacillus keqinensis]